MNLQESNYLIVHGEPTFGSVCSGIEAASVAWHPLGWKSAWLAEIESFPSAVLAHHYPDTRNLGDMTTIADRIISGEVFAPDVLVGGTPCQAFSVAGLRKGLSDERGALSIAFVRLADAIDQVRVQKGKPESVVVWENVHGVLSSRDNAFGCFLGGLAGESCDLQPPGGKWSNAGCVFGPQRTVAWRVLDAQYFGVAQRRRRVFVVASARDGFNPTAVLFESDGVRRDSAPRRETGQGTAWHTGAGTTPRDVAGTLKTECGAGKLTAHDTANCKEVDNSDTALDPNFVAFHHNAQACQLPSSSRDTSVTDPLTCSQGAAVAYSVNLRGRPGGATAELGGDVAGCLRASSGGGDKPHALTEMCVRRLTPRECERLQGFPDDYTLVPVGKKMAADGPRYTALGNSMAVPVMRWIGKRIHRALITTLS